MKWTDRTPKVPAAISKQKAEDKRELTWCASETDGCGTTLALGLLTLALVIVSVLL